MKVYQVINHGGLDQGGAERLARFLHLDALEAGVDGHLISLQTCDLADVEKAETFDLSTPRHPLAFWKLYRTLRSLGKRGNIVHAHLFPTTFFVSFLKQCGLIKAPCIMTEHSTWNRRRDLWLGRLLDRFIYRGFGCVAAISDQTRDELIKSHPQIADRVKVITNGARLRFEQQPIREAKQTETVLLSIGRLAAPKNYGTILKALALIKDLPWIYRIAGGGPDEAALRAQVEELGLTDRVQFLGHVEDVTSALLEADLFLMLSKWEGFGLAAVEAMNAGLPVVASNVPGLSDLMAPTGCPLVSPDDPEKIAEAIGALLNDERRRAALGQAGFSHALNYDTKAMTASYVSLWSRFSEGRNQ